jgi:aminoglycoside phosphotransferase (APT) family kinase protein
MSSPPGEAGRASGRSERLAGHLQACLGEPVRIVSLEQLEGGFSRHTYRLVVATAAEDEMVFALRAEVPSGVLDVDLEREYRILRALSESGFPVPAVKGFEPTGEVIGGRFITMEWASGSAVNPWRSARDSSGGRDELSSSWVADIARLHSLDPSLLRQAGVDGEVSAPSYVAGQSAHWIRRIRESSHPPGLVADSVCRWVEQSIPVAGATTIVHGDLRIGNMLVDGDRVTAFLDWEMAGVGDWRADVGYSLMPYHAGKLLAPIEPSSNGLVHPRRFLDQYLEATGWDLTDEELVFFIVLGCVKMVGILCTGIDAYMDRRSSDPRLAWLNVAIPGLVQDADDLISKGLPW